MECAEGPELLGLSDFSPTQKVPSLKVRVSTFSGGGERGMLLAGELQFYFF